MCRWNGKDEKNHRKPEIASNTLKGNLIMTKKQKITAVLALAFAFSLSMAVMCGCSCFTQEQVAEIHKTVGTILDIAYTSGGAVLVEQRIDQLVADGKITPQQGEMLKEAARRSYEALLEKLSELSVKDVTVEVSE